MIERKLIRVRIDTFQYDDFFCNKSFEEVIDKLQSLKCDLESKGFYNMKFDVSYYYESTEVVLNGDRYENTQELNLRLKNEEKARLVEQKLKAKQDAEELKLYKKLKKKFGDV